MSQNPPAPDPTGTIENSLFPDPINNSPRVVPIGVFDIGKYLDSNPPNGAGGVVRMVKVFGFFIEGFGDIQADGSIVMTSKGKAVVGRLVSVPGIGANINDDVDLDAAYLLTIILVR